MGRGLSELQYSILQLASEQHAAAVDSADWQEPCIYSESILDALYPEKTPAKRVIVSKALRRLAERGLLEGWASQRYATGKRVYYKITEGGIKVLANRVIP